MALATIQSMSPFFIVGDVSQSIAFYVEALGFESMFKQPADHPFFGIVSRDGAMLFLKAGASPPLPNPKREPSMRWDAYCATLDPDALAAELSARGASFSTPLTVTSEGLRGFEITDPDGYVIFFGRPQETAHPASA
jgi:uncharacterized glyoxalase superfamily protein PhnB